MRQNLNWILLLVVLFSNRLECAEKKLTSTEAAQNFLNQLCISTHTPAVSGAVALKGKIVFSAGSGFSDVQRRIPATGKTVYNIGSVSKAVTAVAVMQLIEAKKVRLEDDIRNYVPSFPDKRVKITVRQLLTHTSGIRHYHKTDFPGTPDNENTKPLSWEEGLRIFSADPLLFPPGKYFFYTSYGVNLLQGVVEKASGMIFNQYIKKNVFDPADASSASFDIPGQAVENRAQSYRVVDGKPVDYYYNDLRYKLASGAMIASVEDLVKFASALNAGKLVQRQTWNEMTSPQVRGLREFRENSAPIPMQWKQGFMWRIRNSPYGPIAYECGSIKGSNACVCDFLQEDLVAAIATNSWECCGYKKVDALAAFFRSTSQN
jgi:serine beta-lactamase-like protein LACTB, mitochondrial